MGKMPAFQFYPGDWIQDTRMLTAATRGIWIDMLCAMWRSEVRGTISGTVEELSRLCACSQQEMMVAIKELGLHNIADFVTCNANVTDCNSIVTVSNRRMVRDEKERAATRKRVKRFRNGQCTDDGNANVTPSSSSSSSSSSSKIIKDTLSTRKTRRRGVSPKHPDHQKFIDHWCQQFEAEHDVKYSFTGGKDGNLVKALLKDYSYEFLIKMVERLYATSDKFIREATPTLGLFYSQRNKLAKEVKSWE